MKNQLGSKLIEYIATGKPIINIYQFAECPTINVSEKYPYKFNIVVSDLYENSEVVSEMNKFILKANGKQEEFSKIRQLYLEYTPEYVAKHFMKDIETIFDEER